ncbi:MAG: hypothetical protein JZU65_05700 [Chlorobium sp.]|nr:hypothetical protein [Chlorobium sp.]
MQKCCLIGCDNELLKGINDYCDYHYGEKNKAYFQAVDDALVCWEMTTTGDAKVDLNNLICMEQQVCLDPAVSLNAGVLINRGRKEVALLVAEKLYNGCHIGIVAVIKEKFGLDM